MKIEINLFNNAKNFTIKENLYFIDENFEQIEMSVESKNLKISFEKKNLIFSKLIEDIKKITLDYIDIIEQKQDEIFDQLTQENFKKITFKNIGVVHCQDLILEKSFEALNNKTEYNLICKLNINSIEKIKELFEKFGKIKIYRNFILNFDTYFDENEDNFLFEFKIMKTI